MAPRICAVKALSIELEMPWQTEEIDKDQQVQMPKLWYFKRNHIELIYHINELVYRSIELIYCSFELFCHSIKLICHLIELIYHSIKLVNRSLTALN